MVAGFLLEPRIRGVIDVMRNIRATAFLVLALVCNLLAPGASVLHAQGSVDQRLVARARQITGDDFQILTRTPRGARVFARTTPHAETLRAIDGGLVELFAIARRHGYAARLDYSSYT